MRWTPFILGIIEDPYSLNAWIFVPVGILSFLICYFRSRVVWILTLIISVICGIFLIFFLTPQNYQHISQLAPNLIPTAISLMAFSLLLPIFGSYLNWKKIKKQPK